MNTIPKSKFNVGDRVLVKCEETPPHFEAVVSSVRWNRIRGRHNYTVTEKDDGSIPLITDGYTEDWLTLMIDVNKCVFAYLAAPYTHPDFKIIEERFHAINKQAARLMLEGYVVFSPVSHGHPIHLDTETPFPRTWEFWAEQDLPFLEKCDILFVYQLPGWDESIGVKGEIEFAQHYNIPIRYIG